MSLVDRGELISLVLGLITFGTTVYVAYRISRKRSKGEVKIIDTLNWLSVLILGTLGLIILSGLILENIHGDNTSFLVLTLVSFAYSYGIVLIFLIPLIVILWIYNLIVWIRRQSKRA